MYTKTLLTKSWTISSKITNPNPSETPIPVVIPIKNKTISIKIQAIIFIKTKTIIFTRIKITSILSFNIRNKIKIFNQSQKIISNLHLSYQDKITSSLKINDNYKNKNFKIPPLTNKILSSPNNNQSKDPSKPNNKNPS